MKKITFKWNKKRIVLTGVILLSLLMIGIIIGFIKGKVNATSPVGMTHSYLKRFQKEDKSLTSKITYPFSDNLNSNQEQRYKEIIKKQYRNIKYSILDEYVGEVDSNITVQVSVKDLKETYEQANSYVFAHKDKFLDESGNLDNDKVINYKLEQMEKAKDTIEYSIVINYYKNSNNQWEMTELSSTDLKKISGIF